MVDLLSWKNIDVSILFPSSGRQIHGLRRVSAEKPDFENTEVLKMYKLGCYGLNGELETLRTAETREEARKKYESLKKECKCTICVQKIEFVNPEDL